MGEHLVKVGLMRVMCRTRVTLLSLGTRELIVLVVTPLQHYHSLTEAFQDSNNEMCCCHLADFVGHGPVNFTRHHLVALTPSLQKNHLGHTGFNRFLLTEGRETCA